MIHAFLAGFAGCIGVLVAIVCWNGCSEWLAGREYRRSMAKEAAQIRRERKAARRAARPPGDWETRLGYIYGVGGVAGFMLFAYLMNIGR